uniref:Uncharacterized protein n=1 Tax=Arundo donax TaxID=35708 RepID=A0A0A9CHR7_ARUDO
MRGLAAVYGTMASLDVSASRAGSETSGRGLVTTIGSVSVVAAGDGGLEADGGGIRAAGIDSKVTAD